MKKFLFSSVIFFSVAVLGGAAAEAQTIANPSTKGKIQFEADNDGDDGGKTTDPGDKGKPGDGNEVDPGDEDGGSSTGPLRFTYVPSLDFGTNKLNFSDQAFYPAFNQVTNTTDGTKTAAPNYFEVKDLRGGTDGWTVTLSNDGKLTAAGAEDITVQFRVKNMSINSNSGITGDRVPSVHFTSTTDYTTIGTSATTLVTADTTKKQGYGSYSVLFGDTQEATTEAEHGVAGRNPAVQLFIPKGQIIEASKEYTTDLTWSLNDTK